jgi:hypothetical protein
MTPEDAEWLMAFTTQLDELLECYSDQPPHNLTGALLSRVVLLQQLDPATGKDLVRYVWERLDDIEQANPGDLL